VARFALKAGPVTLAIQGETSQYSFSFSTAGDALVTLGSAPSNAFAFEKTSSFTGAFVGLYAHSDDPEPAPADFAWFEMK
jgi:beta-xylosidase